MGRMAETVFEVQDADVVALLAARFAAHPERHATIAWSEVRVRIEGSERALRSLLAMERTGGEPDVVGIDASTGEYLFVDCSAESPEGRRNLCYDRAALESRKKNKPAGSALDAAAALGIVLLNEDGYRMLQTLGEFDCKTSSWIRTPDAIRDLGGALFCDRRYNHVFTYHNGAESYYGARGFRGLLRV